MNDQVWIQKDWKELIYEDTKAGFLVTFDLNCKIYWD